MTTEKTTKENNPAEEAAEKAEAAQEAAPEESAAKEESSKKEEIEEIKKPGNTLDVSGPFLHFFPGK